MKYKGKIINNNDEFFQELFYKYFNSLTVFATRLINDEETARDLVQEVFMKLWQVDNNFESEIALKTYLYYSTKNICIDFYRKNKKIEFVEHGGEIFHTDNYLKEIVREETYRLIDEALDSLGEKSKEIVKYTMQGCSNNDIADNMGISVNTVKTLKLRSYKILRELLGKQLLIAVLLDMNNYFSDIF